MIAMGSGNSPGWPVPDDGVTEEETDVLSLAGQPVPDDGAWLWVTAAEPRRGGEFTALVLPRNQPKAFGGEVFVQVSPVTRPGGEGVAARVQVWAGLARSLVRVAAWDEAGLGQWPEIARDPVLFALGALAGLQEHGTDVGVRTTIPLDQAAGPAPTSFPSLPASVSFTR
jgi:hypothetical protein